MSRNLKSHKRFKHHRRSVYNCNIQIITSCIYRLDLKLEQLPLSIRSYNGLSQSLTPCSYQSFNCILFIQWIIENIFSRNYLVQHYLVCRHRQFTVVLPSYTLKVANVYNVTYNVFYFLNAIILLQ